MTIKTSASTETATTAYPQQASVHLHRQLFLQSGPVRERKRSRKDKSQRYKDKRNRQNTKTESWKITKQLKDQDLWFSQGRAVLFTCWSGAREPDPPGESEAREPPPPSLKLVNDQDTRRPKSSHSHLHVVRAVSSLYPYECGETNGNGQAETNLWYIFMVAD